MKFTKFLITFYIQIKENIIQKALLQFDSVINNIIELIMLLGNYNNILKSEDAFLLSFSLWVTLNLSPICWIDFINKVFYVKNKLLQHNGTEMFCVKKSCVSYPFENKIFYSMQNEAYRFEATCIELETLKYSYCSLMFIMIQ